MEHSSRHVLSIRSLETGDAGIWTCQSTVENDKELSIKNDNNHGNSLIWKLIVLPSLNQPFVLDSNGGAIYRGQKATSFRSHLNNSAVITVQEGHDLNLYCVNILNTTEADDFHIQSLEDKAAWKTDSFFQTEVSNQLKFEFFVQNEAGLLGLVNILRLSNVGRGANGQILRCGNSGEAALVV